MCDSDVSGAVCVIAGTSAHALGYLLDTCWMAITCFHTLLVPGRGTFHSAHTGLKRQGNGCCHDQVTMAPKTSFMTVHFDQYNPNSEKGTDTRASLASLDYSPLPRLTWRSFLMGLLVSMGGLM
jgi:hypothetical protein